MSVNKRHLLPQLLLMAMQLVWSSRGRSETTQAPQVEDAGREIEMPDYYPGKKLPAHVYQRVGILEAQLRELATRIENNPEWLRKEIRKP